MEHRAWISAEAALESAAEQAIKRGLVTLGGILDRLAAIEQQDKTSHIRKLLAEREDELRLASRDYSNLVHSIGNPDAADRWEDALATCQQKLSAAYFRLLNDSSQANRLIVQAHATARDPHLREAIQRDRQQITRYTLCREAEELMRADNFNAADYKLSAAFASSAENEKEEVRSMQDRCRWGRALRGADTTRANPVLRSVAGFGARFTGQHNTDAATQSYVTHHWLTMLFVPLFPLGAYRVSDAEQGRYQVHGKLPLPGSLRTMRWLIPILLFAVVGSLTLKEVQVGAANQTPAVSNALTERPIATPKVPAEAAQAPVAVQPALVEPVTPVETPPVETPPVRVPPIQTRRAPPDQNVPVRAHLVQPPVPERYPPDEVRTAPMVSAAPADELSTTSLDRRKLALDAEGVDLERQKTYLAAVAAAYEAESVPQSGRALYEKLLSDYQTKVEEHKRKVAQLARAQTQAQAQTQVEAPVQTESASTAR